MFKRRKVSGARSPETIFAHLLDGGFVRSRRYWLSGQIMRILIVEDDLLLANRLVEIFTQAGHEILGVAASADKAIQLLASCECDAAVLDSNLGGSCSEPVAIALSRRGIPFVVVSGHSRDHLLSSLRGAPFLPKPIDPSALLALVSEFRNSTSLMA